MTPTSAARTALITGATGQDGTLLAELLDGQGCRVIGVAKQGSGTGSGRQPVPMHLIEADICDPSAVLALLTEWRPDEIYHLAAVHHSTQDSPHHSEVRARMAMLDTNFGSTKALAFAVLESGISCHVVFAGSSQMYSAATRCHEIDESSPRNPSTFYGHVKSWSADLLACLRSEHGLCASTAILFNHESPLRRAQFLSRKVSRAAAAASLGRPIPLELLNIGSRADWSSANDIVRAMRLMALSAQPRDYVVASGELRSVRGLLEVAFGHVGLDWREFTIYRLDREEPALFGQPRLLETALGWKRTRSFADTINEMVDHDIAIGRRAAEAPASRRN